MSNRAGPQTRRRSSTFRNRNLLVSAAAGSGKTAVLIERILNLISDPVRPVDIDELLVVTFHPGGGGRDAGASEYRHREEAFRGGRGGASDPAAHADPERPDHHD